MILASPRRSKPTRYGCSKAAAGTRPRTRSSCAFATCGVCRTDLHVTEGDLPPKHPGIVPGHEVVGVVEKPWSRQPALQDRRSRRDRLACAKPTVNAATAASGRENLCPNARFTGWDRNGGYAEYAVVREDFAYPFARMHRRRACRAAALRGNHRFSRDQTRRHRSRCDGRLYGFGGSAHLALQVLKHWKCRVFVMSRGGVHRELADELGADWIGEASDPPPAPLDAAILFAPAGDLVPPMLAGARSRRHPRHCWDLSHRRSRRSTTSANCF